MKPNPRLIRSLFILAPALIAIASIVQTLQIPTDPKNTVFLGMSASRLVVLCVLGGAALVLSILATLAWIAPTRVLNWIEKLLGDKRRLAGLGISAGLLLLAATTILAIPDRYLHEYSALVQRARPLLEWLAIASLQALLGLLVWYAARYARYRLDPSTPYRRILQMSFVLLVILLGVWLFVGVTKMGVWPGNAFWGKVAVPVLWPQVLLALICSIAFQWLLFARLKQAGNNRWLEPAICVLLWLAAVALWGAQTFTPGTFTTLPHPPNYQIYPSSDSQGYDLTAESQLLGAQSNYAYFIDKPLYIMFLAFLHLVVGSNYTNLYLLQVAIFAAIPIVGYLLGKTLHSRQLGLMFGILLVLREQNAIALTNVIQVSTSKMILSEPLTTLGILCFTLFLARWLQKPEWSNAQLWIAGGVLGLTGLVRLNALTIVPFALLAIGMALKFKPRPWLVASACFVAVLLISIVPWSIESFHLTGNPLAFIAGKTNGVIVGNRYAPTINAQGQTLTPVPSSSPQPGKSSTPGVRPTPSPTLTSGAPTKAPAGAPTQGRLAAYLRLGENISQHYLHNLISMLVMLPPSGELYSLHDMAVLLPYWTIHWDGRLDSDAYLILFVVLALFSMGVASAWARTGAAGIMPVLVILGYNVSTALALTSGGRYVTPIDWGVLLFFSIGAVELSGWFWGATGRLAELTTTGQPAEQAAKKHTRLALALTALAFVLIGALPVGLVNLPPTRYPATSKSDFRNAAATIPELANPADRALVATLLKSPLTQVQHGRAFYPRYYPANLGEPGLVPPYDQIYPFDRISFYLVGSSSAFVVYPTSDPPNGFDTEADVWVVGCHREQYFEALLIVLTDGKSSQVFTQSPVKTSCQ